jgi:hypothetical protein
MAERDAWNHNAYCVPPEHVSGICECIETLFPWTLIVRKPDLVGYRLGDDLNRGALYLRPSPAARTLYDVLGRLRRDRPELERALAALDAQEPDLNDHQGLRLASPQDWEARVARAGELERTRPDLQVRVVRVERPGDPGALTNYLYQAWIRLGLLGPLRNTFELQALDPTIEPAT